MNLLQKSMNSKDTKPVKKKEPESFKPDYVDIKDKMIQAIDAIEFFDVDEDNPDNVKKLTVDQLYNLPSLIASATNLEPTLRPEFIEGMDDDDLSLFNTAARRNMIEIVVGQLNAEIRSNITRFLDQCYIGKVIKHKWRAFVVDPFAQMFDMIENERSLITPRSLMMNLFDSIPAIHSPSLAEVAQMEGKETEEMHWARTTNIINVLINQLFQCYTTYISYTLDNIISELRFDDPFTIDIDKTEKRIKKYYPDKYREIEKILVYDRYNIIHIFIKQELAYEIQYFYDTVLTNIIVTTCQQIYKTNYYVFEDIMTERVIRKSVKDKISKK